MNEPAALFLEPDLLALEAEIDRLSRRICAYGDEKLPEGPAADVVMAEFQAVLDRLSYLFAFRRRAGVVPVPESPSAVAVGTRVTFLPLTGAPAEPERVSIGSSLVCDRLAAEGFVSCLSDLGLLLAGAMPGDVRRGVVGDEELSFRVLAVEPAVLPAG